MKAPPRALLTPPVGARDHVQGPADARVTLVEYGDFECPFCGAAYPELKRVLRELGPKVRFVFPHFWQMHDLLYQHQAALEDEDLVGYARELGIDADRVMRELVEHTYAARVREDFLSGVRSGVSGTPRFFINGRPHEEPGDAKTLAATTTVAGARPKKKSITGDKYRVFLDDGWTLHISEERGLPQCDDPHDPGRLRHREVEVRARDRVRRPDHLGELVGPAGVPDDAVDRALDLLRA